MRVDWAYRAIKELSEKEQIEEMYRRGEISREDYEKLLMEVHDLAELEGVIKEALDTLGWLQRELVQWYEDLRGEPDVVWTIVQPMLDDVLKTCLRKAKEVRWIDNDTLEVRY